MQKKSLYSIVAALALTAGIYSCNRINGVDNNQVIETPYSLYFADSAGAVYNSNDGRTVKLIFPADGKPCRALCTSGNNVLIIKDNVYYSTDNGKNFNHSYDSVEQAKFPACGTLDSLPQNQTMVIDLPDWPRTFISTNDPRVLTETIIGASSTENTHGTYGSWYPDLPDSNGNVGFVPIAVHSFTKLTSGVVVGYDAVRDRVVYREKSTLWKESTGNSAGHFGVGAPTRQTGTGLPDTAYCFGHFNNQLIALVNRCSAHGAWFSEDTGRNWTAYSGLPQNALLCIAAPFEQTCLVGTKGAGLYVLNLNTSSFQQVINGLASNLHIRSITAKQNIYKNGNVEKSIFIATNQGIYVSKDNGINWTLTIQGNFTAIY
jgi:hypothetical protein